MKTTDPIGVIGGGLGGLAAACTLAARGYAVTLFERNDWLGGKAAVLETQGFRFDMGPTLLTVPRVLRRVFAEAGEKLADHVELVRLDPQWRCFFEDGTSLDLVENIEAMAGKLATYSPQAGVAEGYRRFMVLSEQLNEISRRVFFWRSVGGLGDVMAAQGMFSPQALRDVMTLRMGRTVTQTIKSHVADPRVAQLMEHFTQYVGSAPDQSPAVLCGIAHMQTDEGVWYPMGGTSAIPRALAGLAQRLGVNVRAGTGVRQITRTNGAVTGVETDTGEIVALSAVVSNSDSVLTHRELIDGDPSQRFFKRRDYEPACSGVVLYLGLKKRYEHLLHHCFMFSRDPHEEFETIYRKGEPAPDPTLYVCAPSATEAAVAPAGGEALYILAHTPYLRAHHDWTKLLPDYRRVILDKIKRTANLPDLEDRIVCEAALTPADIERRYHVLDGAIYGLASHGRFFGAFKPGNRSPDLKGFYLCGGTAHPGPGMPMVMMSGWIAADTLDQDRRGKLVAGDAAAASWQRVASLN